MAGTMPASLEDLLSGTRVEGQEKTASPQSRPVGQEETNYATELAMLEKFAQENFTHDDILKIAASSKISADIMTDIQIEKLASAMPILVKVAMEHVLPQILPAMLKEALQKVAVGDSEVISGGKASDTVEKDPHAQTATEDEHGKSDEPVGARQMAHANRTEGASTEGGGDPESNKGEPTANTHGNTVAPKVAQDHLQQVIAQKLGGQKQAMDGMMPGADAGGGGEEAMAAMIQQKLAAGIPLSPEEQQFAQAMGLGGGGMPPGGGGMPPGGGGMEHMASAPMTAAQKEQLFAEMLRSRIG